MNNKHILKWEIIGFFIILLLGTASHFCFEWSGNFKPFALLFAVNESVWEHAKIGFWPSVFFAIVEYFALGRKMRNFLFAKTFAFYIVSLVIILAYYLLKVILGTLTLWVNIGIFVLAILLAQWFSYRIITSRRNYSRYNVQISILLGLILVSYSLFTYFPPKLELFRDPPTGGYGILKK